MPERFEVELDTVIPSEGWDGDRILSGPPAQLGVSVELARLHGPAGGNPVFRYSGAAEDLVPYIARHFSSLDVTPETLEARLAEAREILGL